MRRRHSPILSAPAASLPTCTCALPSFSVSVTAKRADPVVMIAGVADLAAALCVERRDVEDHLALLARLQLGDRILAAEQRDDAALAGFAVVADERGVRVNAQVAAQVDVELAGSASTRALRIHRRLETRLVDGQAALARDVGGEVHREAVGVVEPEHGLARNHLRARRACHGRRRAGPCPAPASRAKRSSSCRITRSMCARCVVSSG